MVLSGYPILDNPNTHKKSAIYEMYGLEEGDRLISKLEFHYIPIHASWLNVAEIEICVMDTECTRKWVPEKERLRQEVMAWERYRNKQKCKIDWKFTREKVDKKLSKYYV